MRSWPALVVGMAGVSSGCLQQSVAADVPSCAQARELVRPALRPSLAGPVESIAGGEPAPVLRLQRREHTPESLIATLTVMVCAMRKDVPRTRAVFDWADAVLEEGDGFTVQPFASIHLETIVWDDPQWPLVIDVHERRSPTIAGGPAEIEVVAREMARNVADGFVDAGLVVPSISPTPRIGHAETFRPGESRRGIHAAHNFIFAESFGDAALLQSALVVDIERSGRIRRLMFHDIDVVDARVRPMEVSASAARREAVQSMAWLPDGRHPEPRVSKLAYRSSLGPEEWTAPAWYLEFPAKMPGWMTMMAAERSLGDQGARVQQWVLSDAGARRGPR